MSNQNVFLLTRFNLKICKQTKNGLDARSELWLQKRFALFEHYCYPSIRQQTYKEFKWLCLFADDTPQAYLDRLEVMKSECPQLCVVLMNDDEGLRHQERLVEMMDEMMTEGETIITLRVDNDDILRKDFIEQAVLHSTRQTEDKAMYWFRHGLQLYSQAKTTFIIDYPKNQFPFLVNKHYQKGDPTILSFSHIVPNDSFPHHIIEGKPMWMENVHDGNVVNEVMFTTKQRPYGNEEDWHDDFLPAVKKRVGGHGYHVVTFLLPRMMRQFLVRLKMKLLHEHYG